MTWSYQGHCNCERCRLERIDRRAQGQTQGPPLLAGGVVKRWLGADVRQPPMEHNGDYQSQSPKAASIEPPALDYVASGFEQAMRRRGYEPGSIHRYGRSPAEVYHDDVEPLIGPLIQRMETIMNNVLPTDAKARKALPIATGVLDYFPDALAAVAHASKVGNDQHSPGEPLHWAKEKSTDEADCLIRHFLERGTTDTDGVKHSAKVAWRALALLQREIEFERNKADYLSATAAEDRGG